MTRAKNILSLIIVALFIVPGLFHARWPSATSQNKPSELVCAEIFPEATDCVRTERPAPHFIAYAHNRTLGLVFHTTDVVPGISGYGGPISMAVGIFQEGVIKSIKILRHAETAAYTGDLNPFTAQFIGRSKDSPLTIGKDIDSISGATISSEAIARSIRQGMDLLMGSPAKPLSPLPKAPLFSIGMIALILASAIAGFLNQKHLFRWTALSLGLIYLGIMKNTMLSILHPINAALGQFPGFMSAPLLWALLIGSLCSIFLFGNIYCGSVCPFAVIQDILFKLGRSLKFPTCHEPPVFTRWRHLKYAIIILITLLALLLRNSDVATIELFVLLFSWKASALGWAFIILTLCASLFIYRLWCKYFCPAGMLLGILSQVSLFKIRPKDKNCHFCRKCATNCPTQAIQTRNGSLTIDQSDCICCGNCLTQCPKGNFNITPFYEKQ